MALASGARFGPYEILSPLGAGGMGEVYRALDTRLQRSVALKVLPDAVANDPERIARLRREARTLASLNDPNIAAIFGFEEDGGRHALAPAIRNLIVRCLDKDRSERVVDISTARYVLSEPPTAGVPPTERILAAPQRWRPRTAATIVAAAALGVVAGAGAIAWLQRSLPTATTPRSARFELAVSRTDPLASKSFGTLVAISPDGSRLVYTTLRDGIPLLMTRRMDQLDTTAIAGTEGAVYPFFSPDGRQVGFFAASELRRVPIEGGRSVTIWRGDPTFEGASWADDGTIVFSQSGALFRVSENGGQAARFAEPDATREEIGFDNPAILPGGAVVLYTAELPGSRSRIAARPIQGGAPTTVLEGGFGARYLPPGYLVYAQADRLMAVRFEAATLRTSGTPVALEQGVFTTVAEAISNVAIAADGTAVFVSGRNPGILGRPVWVDRSGAHLSRLTEQPLEQPRSVRLSPDGKRLALTLGPSGQGSIWIYDTKGSAQPYKLTFRDHNPFPTWSPDGEQIAFLNIAGAASRVMAIGSDGSAVEPRPLTQDGSGAVMDWGPGDAGLLLFRDKTLWSLKPPATTARAWLEPAPFTQFGARFSHDGRWVAYVSTQSGAAEVWVRPFPGPGAPVRVSPTGGHEPAWSRDDKEMSFASGSKMMAAHVTTATDGIHVDAPAMLFEGGFYYDTVDLVLRYYDVAPDGRFLMIEPSESKNASLVVAQHWDEELRGRLPK